MEIAIAYQWRKSIPGPVRRQSNGPKSRTAEFYLPEGNKEAKPGEEEYPAVHVDNIEERYRSGLVIDRVDFRSPEEDHRVEHFGSCQWRTGRLYCSWLGR